METLLGYSRSTFRAAAVESHMSSDLPKEKDISCDSRLETTNTKSFFFP